MEKKVGFNLLKPQLSPENRWDRVYEWVSSTARGIVIFVEFIVIICFVARVVVDRQARDLEEALKENKIQLDNLAEIEADILKLQRDLGVYSNIWISSNNYSPYIEEVYNYNPALFNQNSISFDEDGAISINGIASEDDLGELEVAMKNSISFKTVELLSFAPDKTSGKSEGEFQIRAQIANYRRSPLTKNVTQGI